MTQPSIVDDYAAIHARVTELEHIRQNDCAMRFCEDRGEQLRRRYGDVSDEEFRRLYKKEWNDLYGVDDVGQQPHRDRNAKSILLRTTTGRKLVFVREDNELNMHLFGHVLEGLLNVVIFMDFNGLEIYEAARTHRPDLIQSDILGPNQSGLDLARQLKGDPLTKDIPLLCTTAFAMKGDLPKVSEAGFDAYMAKPVWVPGYVYLVDSLLCGRPTVYSISPSFRADEPTALRMNSFKALHLITSST